MDFKSLVNKESFKIILQHHLKNQLRTKFGTAILRDILKHSENELVLSEDIVDSLSNNISYSEESKEFMKTFLGSLDTLFEDRDQYVPKEENQGTLSQCSSASSISTSIDYISFDQFQDIIQTLTSGVNAEKLEALETFSRLPSLEYIIKKTLWPSVENGLHSALLNDVSFIKDASLKVFVKMLSSSEPKVVQESFNSVINFLLQYLLPSINQNTDDFVKKCKLAVEIIAVLNRFLQNIPNHWLRYPQPVIEDITVQSFKILSFGSCGSNSFPIWLCIALCDKKSNWFKTLLYGNVSRTFILDTLLKDSNIIKFCLQFCENFFVSDDCISWTDECCQKFAEISETCHIICFLSYLLQYSQSREIFSAIANDGDYFSWLNVLNLIMKCTLRLSLVSCINCSSVIQDIVSKLWFNLWSCDKINSIKDPLIKILLSFEDVKDFSTNGVHFVMQCLSHSYSLISNSDTSKESIDMLVDYLCALFNYIANFSYDFPENITPETLKMFNSGLLLTCEVLSVPSELFSSITFVKIFSVWCSKVNSIAKILATSYIPGTKCNSIKDTEDNISKFCIAMLQKPNCIIILQNLELFDSSINSLLEKILEDIRIRFSVCPRDICILSNALNNSYLSNYILNKSVVFKLSSVIWLLENGESANLSKLKDILQILMPSIFFDILEGELFLDVNCDSDKLFQSVILYPSVIKEEFVMFEEHKILSLQVISTLSSSILSSCYLEAKYKLSSMLFDLQLMHYDERDIPLVDPLSVIQNHLLVKLNTIGGPDEKILPPETLLKNDEDYKWPFFKYYPVPDVYFHEIIPTDPVDMDIAFELNGENLKDIFLEYLEDELLTVDVIGQILKASSNILEPSSSFTRTLNFVSLEDVYPILLQDEIVHGLEMVKRYGRILNLMTSEDGMMLDRLLKAGKGLLNSENRFQLDIFICTICLIFRCDMQASWTFLETFAKSPSSFFIWYERILQVINQNEKYMSTFNAIMEDCDIIVKKTLPLVYAALQFSGILPSMLYKYWTIHCYWNYLNFSEIAQFILMSVLLGGDYALYFFVSVLKHMQSTILKNAHNSNLLSMIKQNPIKGYKIQNFINFIIDLGDVFHNKILESVNHILDD